LPLAYTDVGEQQVKNIDEAIRAFAVRPERRRNTRALDINAPNLALPDKPSIAVLAFTTTTPEDEYLGDGIADDVITALSKMRWLFVIARNSAFSYKGAALEISQIARQLGVAYVLTGNVRRSSNRVRISLQLAEADTGRSLWAERFDRELGDVFALQDEIAERVAGAIEPELLKNEGRRASAARPSTNPSAWDLVRRGMWEFHKVSPESHRASRDLFAQAVRLAPEFAEAHIWLSRSQAGLAAYGWTDDPERAFQKALAAALRGVQLDEQNPYAHYAVAVANVFGGQVATARRRLNAPLL
jgi:adenylate cyclase